MKKLDAFLNDLSDHELCVFTKYRYMGFLDGSKEKISTEIKKRNLTTEQLEVLSLQELIEAPSEKIKCPRCGSNRLYVESDHREIPVGEFASAEIAIDSYRCRLCGYNASKTTPSNLFEKIKRIFKVSRNSRFVKFNDL